MVNYPFAFPTTEETAPDVAENMSAAKFPAVADDVESAPPLGGINLGVSAFSENPDLAFEAIECLVQPENQLEIASAGGLPPVREDLYEEPELEETYPGYADVIFDSIRDAQARPSEAPAYQDVTLAIQRSLHPTDEIDPENPTPTYEELLEAVQQAVAREGIL
jgi:multiple sugar transport system substrate-binding protein